MGVKTCETDTTCLETTTTSSQLAVTQETSEPSHPIHIPPRAAMLDGLAILAQEAGKAEFDVLARTGLREYELREINALNLYGRGIWSKFVPGTLRPDIPALIDFGRWRELRNKVREAGAPWRRLAESMSTCGLQSKVFQCRSCGDQAPLVCLPVVCMSRYCQHCSKAKRRRSQARAATVVERFSSRIRFLTLTIRTEKSLESSTKTLRTALTKLRRRAFWKSCVDGGLVTIESVINKEGFHPHAHMLLDGRYMAQARLVDEWMSVNGCQCQRSRAPGRKAVMCCQEKWTDKRGVYETCHDAACPCTGSAAGPAGVCIKRMPDQKAAVREICKYACKELGACKAKGADGKYRDMTAAEVVEFLKNTTGRRLLMTFGSHYDLERELTAEVEDKDPLPDCEGCGQNDFIFRGFETTTRELLCQKKRNAIPVDTS